jgi:hypothetical protein
MEERKMKELMIDYLEGNLTGELNIFVANHIKKSEKWTKEYENLKEVLEVMENNTELTPPPDLKAGFEEMLAKEMTDPVIENIQPTPTKTIYWESPRMWMQIAASVALVIIGVFAGNKITSNANQKEIMALREEMGVTKKLVLSSLQNQSASSRINAVNATYKISTVDNDIVNALIMTLDTDENANVRLAAMDALSEFADEEKVRAALISSLSTQDKPIVQIALINLMVQLKEKRAISALQLIIDDEKLTNTVRDEASYGIIRL